ncbi:MAG: hypothetical protein KC912_26595 [Proteobacteria bacterium]|nr:hypothetical protein [Pseudomonadota bacterium]
MAENEETPETAENAEESAESTPGTVSIDNPLSKATDRAERPGFRSKKNTGSNAMKKNKRKKKKR